MTPPISKIIGFTFVVQLIIFSMVVLNNVLLTHWLNPLQFGVMATVLILTDGLNKGTNLGMESAILFFVSRGKPAFKDFLSSNWINSIVIYGGSLLAGGLLLAAGLKDWLFDTAEQQFLPEQLLPVIAWLIFAAVVHEYGGNIWLGQQRFRSYNLNILIRPFLYLSVLLGLFFTERLSVVTVLLGYGLAWLLPGAWIWLKTLPHLSWRWGWDITRETLKYGIPMMGSRFLDFLIYRLDLLLIAWFLTQREVAWYYLAVMIAERLLYLNKATQIVIVPAGAHSQGQQEKTPLITRVNLLFVLGGAVLMALILPPLVPHLFGDGYQGMNLPLLLLLPGIAALSVSRVLAADFAARGLPGYTVRIAAANMVLSLILNLMLIPRMGVAGAAISSTLAYLATAGLSLVLYRRLTDIPLADLLVCRISDFADIQKI
ncbi:MAG TPA: oligosaccharide flippase family protein [Calditrichia bacterium]|nr:oligosaccharide flippase family protein [Calditrichota bacterium]HQU72819.1 oligosaccharide flippase family protein [Calditrichia bacterium]HQV30299.1 oligosaccharide flippase family protein [Calditrichia bacterium]